MRILTDKNILSALECPVCGAGMRIRGSSIVCDGARTHCFDLGGGGYVNFGAPGQSGGGDSKSAVRARSMFLDTGYYSPVDQALRKTVRAYADPQQGIVIDAGCGEGYYSNGIAKEGFSVMGVDLSKFAADAAAKRSNALGVDNAFFAVASVFDIPVADGCASAVTNVFAPCVEKEYARVLVDDGVLIVVSAGPEHLMGLKRLLYTKTHENGERADMPEHMIKESEERLRFNISVEGNDRIQALFAMTPYYWRTSKDDAAKLCEAEQLDTEIDMIITVYRNTRQAREET